MPQETNESAGSSVVHPIDARLNLTPDTLTPLMTGGVSSTSAVSVTGPLPPSPSSLSKYSAVIVSPLAT